MMKDTPEVTSEHFEVASGVMLGGRFRIIRLLGRGAMGGVYLAQDTLLTDELVALKVFGRGAHRGEDGLERFVREAQIGRRVAHPNVCRVFDLQSEDDVVYVSMEYVPGQSLATRLKLGALPETTCKAILKQVIEGLSAIHYKGIVHRDLKPSNILLTSSDQVKIIDFGLARMLQSDLTATSTLMGTAIYLAPELWDGADPSFRSDMYALGVIGYQMVTGATPWEKDSMVETMRSHIEREPNPPSEMVKISAEFEDLILSLLDKEPSRRPLCDSEECAEILGVSVIARRHSGAFWQPSLETGAMAPSLLATSPLAASRSIEPASGAFKQLASERGILASLLLGAVVCAAAVLSGVCLQVVTRVFGTSIDEPMTVVGSYGAIMVSIFFVSIPLSRGAFRLGLTSNDRAVREVLQRHLRGLAIILWLSLFIPIVAVSLPVLSSSQMGPQLVTSALGAAVLFLQVVALVPIQWGVAPMRMGDGWVWTMSNPPSLYSLIVAYLVLLYWVYLLGGLLRPPKRKISERERRDARVIAAQFLSLIAIESLLTVFIPWVPGGENLVFRQTLMYFSPTQWLLSLVNVSFVYWANLKTRSDSFH